VPTAYHFTFVSSLTNHFNSPASRPEINSLVTLKFKLKLPVSGCTINKVRSTLEEYYPQMQSAASPSQCARWMDVSIPTATLPDRLQL
jgi:hypothetical protein